MKFLLRCYLNTDPLEATARRAILVGVRGFTTCADTWCGVGVNYFGEFLTYEAARAPVSFAAAP